MDGKSAKASDAPADPALLHKKMLQLLSSLWVTRAVGAFARLGLADVMEDGAEDAAAIAAARGLSADRVYRLLRALSTVGIVSEPARGRFVLTPLGRLLGSRSPDATRTTAIFLNDYFADMWTHLDEALVGDRTAFEALKGRPFFAWLSGHPDEAKRFNRMMFEVHGPETPAIVAAYDFSPFEHVVDIGGGNGALLSAVLAAYPDRRGTLFDMAEAIAAAKRGEGGPLPGVTFVDRRRVRERARGRRRLSDPPSAARLRRCRMRAHSRATSAARCCRTRACWCWKRRCRPTTARVPDAGSTCR